jgi:methionyl-tRNA formyltransferase
MRILFAASPGIAIPCLEALCNIDNIELVGVLTNPDSAKGRSGAPVPTEAGEAAEKFLAVSLKKFDILKPVKLDAKAREQVSALKPDLLVSFAYGRLFGPRFLSLFPLGGINIHPSLLPKYRGPSPIQAAILNRDTVTGVSIQTLALEMDCGDILAAEQLQLTGTETALSLSETVSKKAPVLLSGVLKKIADGTAQKHAQNNSEASYCKLFSKDDSFINWEKSALEIDAVIRAFTPWPLCRTIHKERELIILKASIHRDRVRSVPLQGKPGLVLGTDMNYGILIQTGDGILAVTELQYQAKKALFWRDFINGARDFQGSQLG